MNVKTFALAAAAAALSVGGALATTGPASAAGDCQAGFCGRQVTEGLTPNLALADSSFHRVIGTANLTTGASIYDWKPALGPNGTACPAGFDSGAKVALWDPAKDAGTSGLFLTQVNGTQVYNHPGNINYPPANQVWCHNYTTGSWSPKSALGLEIRTQGNGLAVTLVPTGDGSDIVFHGVS